MCIKRLPTAPIPGLKCRYRRRDLANRALFLLDVLILSASNESDPGSRSSAFAWSCDWAVSHVSAGTSRKSRKVSVLFASTPVFSAETIPHLSFFMVVKTAFFSRHEIPKNAFLHLDPVPNSRLVSYDFYPLNRINMAKSLAFFKLLC